MRKELIFYEKMDPFNHESMFYQSSMFTLSISSDHNQHNIMSKY